MTVIELPGQQAEALKPRAAAQGLTLEGTSEQNYPAQVARQGAEPTGYGG